MSIRTEHGYGPLTVTVGWLDNCPNCNNDKVSVTGWSVSPDTLWVATKPYARNADTKAKLMQTVKTPGLNGMA